ncbi:glycosyltransferase family 2 protein [Cellulosilyticum sp. ST5]|uniref:glycosyltransferase family 2 protein n=1 Tax=unclassified Cellulosilyticum TaxID=2643091 RepID=UPI000F8CAFF4|nr:glycosyltransferase family 2 protein [Cellulosilyticum sp. WCF-2]QEH68889.1 glycosyltransferase family 2 protein [Cellulosilyticum sp. WCF-2]
MEKISIIVPSYNEELSLQVFYEELLKVRKKMNNISYEIWFIDDGSSDNTLEVIKQIAQDDKSINYISFSRNFGKEAAMLAGLKQATGNYIAIMDADLQDPPSLLLSMYEYIQEPKCDCVAARRINRCGESKIKSVFAKLFYKIINKISDIDIVDGARDFRLMKRKVVDSILQLSEYNRFSKGIFSWVGFNTKWIEYTNVNRAIGETKWSFWKLFLYAIEGVTAFSTVPLAIASLVGMVLFVFSVILIIVIIIKTLVWGDPVSGWPSMICVIFFVSGIQLFCIGILGQYLAKTYMETKKRPIYLIKESSNNHVSQYMREEDDYAG